MEKQVETKHHLSRVHAEVAEKHLQEAVHLLGLANDSGGTFEVEIDLARRAWRVLKGKLETE